MTQSRLVPTPLGDARVIADLAARPVATVVLGHGAGGGAGAPDLRALAAALPPRRVSVLRVEQPWRVRGGRIAPPPPRLDIGWVAAVEATRDLEPTWLTGPLVLGGRSAGARVACRTADRLAATGVLALAFPLHPPGRPDRSRVGELTALRVPALVVQGDRDTFGGPPLFPAGTELYVVRDGDHALRVRRQGPLTAAEAMELMTDAVRRWMVRLVDRGRPATPSERRP